MHRLGRMDGHKGDNRYPRRVAGENHHLHADLLGYQGHVFTRKRYRDSRRCYSGSDRAFVGQQDHHKCRQQLDPDLVLDERNVLHRLGRWTGTKSLNGTLAVSPSSSTIYTLTCVGASGMSSAATTSVTVTAVGGSPSGGLNFTSAPTLSGVKVLPNRSSVIIQVPAVANARDFRVLVAPTTVKGNSNGTESVTGGTQFCAGLRQHQARTRFVADNVTQFPYYFFLNDGHDSPTNQVPQFFGPPPGTWSFHDLDTPPNLQIEVTGVTSSMTVTVEAMDRLCPFPGTIGRTHADILLSHTKGDNDNPGNPWIDASSLTTFPIVTEAEVIAKYGSLIINGQGWAVARMCRPIRR